jgi:2,4-dienoyl-CoA reductase (NADPH2)
MPVAAASLPHVFAPGAIGGLRLPHRVVMGSMHLGTESAPDAGAALAAFYGERARAGAGLIVTGGWAVSRVGAGGRSYGFVNEDAGGRALERVAGTIRELRAGGGCDASIALQLFHAGRYAFEDAFGLVPVAPSVVPSRFSGATPIALGDEQVWETIEDFARGARRAVELGFDAVELMGSEGYLVDQFLSPLTNRRDDAWGGDPARRMRFGLELARAVRAAVGDDFPVIFRLTGADLIPGSTAQDDVLAFAAALAEAGVDALNVGIGWHESPVPTVQGVVPPGVWTPVAALLKEVVGPALPVIAGNRVNRLADADALLGDGGIDFVSMARPFLADAELIAKARAAKPVNVCIACNQACIDRSIGDGHVSCLVNPRAGFELEFPLPDAAGVAGGAGGDAAARRFAVVGGGPAGLEAARALAALGQRVELFEAADELGGQFRYARLVPGKEDFGATIAYFELELPRLGVTVHLGRPLTGDDGDAALLAGFDGVVLATGVLPRTVALAGAELPHVVDYARAFTDGVGDARRVAIVGGGGIAVDLAHRLSHAETAEDAGTRFRRTYRIGEAAPADAGTAAAAISPPHAPVPQVTLMRRSGRIGAGMGRSTRWVWLDALRRAGVSTRTGLAYEAIVPAGVAIVPDGGERELIPADSVVIAAGQERNDALRPLLERLAVPHRVVGGAHDAAELNAVRAFGDGLRAAHELTRG